MSAVLLYKESADAGEVKRFISEIYALDSRGKANALATIVEDSVVLADEDVTHDPERADLRGQVDACKAEDADGLALSGDRNNVVLAREGERHAADGEGDSGHLRDGAAVDKVLAGSVGQQVADGVESEHNLGLGAVLGQDGVDGADHKLAHAALARVGAQANVSADGGGVEISNEILNNSGLILVDNLLALL